MKTFTLTLGTCILGAGCLSGETTAAEARARVEQPLQAEAEATTTDQICRSLLQRQRACTAEYIPALVEARVARDEPPGLAARQRELGRDALVQEALQEWETDSSEPAIAALCDDIAQSISPVKDRELRSSAGACLAEAGCEAFVTCAVPLSLVRWKS